jgi:hypothetical protein
MEELAPWGRRPAPPGAGLIVLMTTTGPDGKEWLAASQEYVKELNPDGRGLNPAITSPHGPELAGKTDY